MKKGRRGLGSLNLASKTFFALARLAAARSSVAFAAAGRGAALGASTGSSAGRSGLAAGAGAGERSSLMISSGVVEMSGSLSRVSTGLRSAAAVPAPPASALSPSLRARRCASSFAFSAFLSASSSRLMGSSTLGPAARPERRLELARIGLGEEIFARQLVAQALEVAVDTRIADHRRAQEDD